jgi:hypothetical protein
MTNISNTRGDGMSGMMVPARNKAVMSSSLATAVLQLPIPACRL